VVCASLLLTRPLGGAYLTYITDEQVAFTAVIEMSSLVERRHFGGHHLVYLPCYLPSEHADFDLDDEAWRRRFLAGVRRLYPDLADAQIAALQIARSRHVLAIATRGYSQLVPQQITSLAGLFVINSAQIVNAALSVNDTVRLAEASVAGLLS
jgi:protoporphyrinogen oxidase